MNIDCAEHRKSMELLSLKVRFEKGIKDTKEQESVRIRIKELEKELRVD